MSDPTPVQHRIAALRRLYLHVRHGGTLLERDLWQTNGVATAEGIGRMIERLERIEARRAAGDGVPGEPSADRWEVTVVQEGEDWMLPIPEELMRRLGWREGDTLTWGIHDEDGSETVTLRKDSRSGPG